MSEGSDEAGARHFFTPAPRSPPPLPQLPGEEKSRAAVRHGPELSRPRSKPHFLLMKLQVKQVKHGVCFGWIVVFCVPALNNFHHHPLRMKMDLLEEYANPYYTLQRV